jgi:hypothetical protein
MVLCICSVHPGIPLEPAYRGLRSQIIDKYFGSILTTRGHAYGLQTYPSGETWTLREVTSVKHTYGIKPVQSVVSSYTRGTVFVVGSSLNWFNVQNAKSKFFFLKTRLWRGADRFSRVEEGRCVSARDRIERP